MSYKNKIESILKELNKGLYERDQAIRLTLLAFLSGKSAFLYGPPGTAKSLIARRVALAFEPKDSKHTESSTTQSNTESKGNESSNTFFAYLMNRFSTPEEIFGPIDIAELKKNRLVRNTQGYLPTAQFAFLDEIWKSSPAILNTLLTIINEKIYRDGNTDIKVPLKGLVCASNEFPTPNQGLEALYDRLVIRLAVLPMQEKTSFEALLQEDFIEPNISTPFTQEELSDIAKKSRSVRFSSETLEVLHFLKANIESYNKSLLRQSDQADKEAQSSGKADSESIAQSGIYISDRRWKNMAELLKSAAVLSDRDEVLPIDITLLSHCLWNDDTHKEVIANLISRALSSSIDMSLEGHDLQDLKDIYSNHYDAVVNEFYSNGKPKSISQTTKDLYIDKCSSLIDAINAFYDEIEQKAATTAEKMKNPFLDSKDYKLGMQGIVKAQDEIKQIKLAMEQLSYIIQHQPTPIPPKYGEVPKQAPQLLPPQQQEKHKPQNKIELQELVNNESINLGDIDTSLIKSMRKLFMNSNRTDFSGIETWDTSSVTNMECMFEGAINFNHNINDWNVSNVENMNNMFYDARSFNQPLDKWNVSKVKNMNFMFYNASRFNQDLESWNVEDVKSAVLNGARGANSFGGYGSSILKAMSTISTSISASTHMKRIFEGSGMQKLPSWYNAMWDNI